MNRHYNSLDVDSQIDALCAAAVKAGDERTVAVCDRARAGDVAAIRDVVDTLEDTAARCGQPRDMAVAADGCTASAAARGMATAGRRGVATAGDFGVATAGDGGAATAGRHGVATAGDRGTATAGDRGRASAGEWGVATVGEGGDAAVGRYGLAVAGAYGIATAGVGGTAAAGDGGELRIQYRRPMSARRRTLIGYVGEGGIMPGVLYRVEIVDGAAVFAAAADEGAK